MQNLNIAVYCRSKKTASDYINLMFEATKDVNSKIDKWTDKFDNKIFYTNAQKDFTDNTFSEKGFNLNFDQVFVIADTKPSKQVMDTIRENVKFSCVPAGYRIQYITLDMAAGKEDANEIDTESVDAE